MKLFRKLVLGGIIALVLLVFIGGGIAVAAANSLARKGIETGATYALGVDTSLGSARVGIFSGELGLSRLDVHNPDGFQSHHFLELGHGGVAVTLPTLLKDTIEVPRFSLDAMNVYL